MVWHCLHSCSKSAGKGIEAFQVPARDRLLGGEEGLPVRDADGLPGVQKRRQRDQQESWKKLVYCHVGVASVSFRTLGTPDVRARARSPQANAET